MKDSKLYLIIRELRTSHNWTQEQLAEKLVVNPQAVKAWESPSKRALPKLDKLLAMCDLFHCDLDHLTGRLPESTHDIRFVKEFTGLSEEAIKKIHAPELDNPYGKTLSRIIESERFSNLITTYKIFLNFLDKVEAEDLEKLSDYELNNDSVILGRNEAVNHFKQQVTLAMGQICDTDHMTRLSQLELKKNITDLDSLKREIRSTKSEIAYLTEHLEFLEGEVLPEMKARKKK